MAVALGAVSINGTLVERTYNITIDCPAESPEATYTIFVHREIVVLDVNGKVLRTIRTRTDEYPSFVPRFSFTALEAVSITPSVLSDIRYTVEELRKSVK